MNEVLFQITCPSCETSFEVTDSSLVGQIVACPKCGGMILIEEPEAESPSPDPDEVAALESEDDLPTPTEPDADAICERADSNADEERVAERDAGDALKVDKDRERASRALAMTLGVFSALVLTSIVSFIFYYVKTPESKFESSPEVVAPVAEPSDAESGDSSEPASVEPSAENLVENGEKEDVDAANVFQDSDGTTEDVETAERTEEIDSESVVDESELVEVGNEGDEGAIDDVALPPDVEPSETQTLDEAEPEFASDEESVSDDEALDDAGLNAEFNEAEFAKANQVDPEDETNESEEEDLGAVAMTVDVESKRELPILSKPARNLDVAARLKLRISSIEFPESPSASVRLLAEFSGVPIEFDLEGILLLRSSLNRKLDLKLENVDVETALTKLAEMLKWRVDPRDDRVVIESVDAPGAVVEERFDASDLLGVVAPIRVLVDESPSEATTMTNAALCEYLSSFLTDSESEDSSHLAPLRCEDSQVMVTRDGIARKRVEILLSQLRAVKRLSQDAQLAPELVVPETLGWQTLSQRTNFNLLKPTSLQSALAILESKFDVDLLWDDATLNAAGIGRDSKTLARIESESLDQILFDLLEPLKLTYIILDEKLLLVTSQERANQYRTVEIHNFADPDAEVSEKEIYRLTTEMLDSVAHESWNESDSVIWLDLESKCWIVRQTQPIQREIRRWTREHTRRTKNKPSGKLSPARDEPASVPSTTESLPPATEDGADEPEEVAPLDE